MKNVVKMVVKLMLVMMLAVSLAMVMAGCGSGSSGDSGESAESSSGTQESAETEESEESEEAQETVELMKAEGIGIHHATIEVEDYGTISLELDGDEAPITVQNFMDLANSGFYDGLTFHRIIDGFIIQGGDPLGTGMGGSDQNITGEFIANGYENNISHKEGVISMARAQDYNSGSSQFFIMVDDREALDGLYAAFGHVTEGQDIVDKIAADANPTDSNGTIAAEDQPVITKITIID